MSRDDQSLDVATTAFLEAARFRPNPSDSRPPKGYSHAIAPPTPTQLRALQSDLDARATEKSRAFWTRYLKGDATFRGVPMADVRAVVHAWWKRERFGELDRDAQLAVALRLFEEAPTEDKLAGVLVLSEILLPVLTKDDLPAFAELFERGLIADWNQCDWFCVKVLGNLVEAAADPLDAATALSSWRTAEPLWQRRASCVAFVYLAQHGDARIPGLSGLILANARALVQDPARFAQTGAAWALRELSRADRAAVVAFAEAEVTRLSREAMKSLVQKLPKAEQRRLLALHAAAG